MNITLKLPLYSYRAHERGVDLGFDVTLVNH